MKNLISILKIISVSFIIIFGIIFLIIFPEAKEIPNFSQVFKENKESVYEFSDKEYKEILEACGNDVSNVAINVSRDLKDFHIIAGNNLFYKDDGKLKTRYLNFPYKKVDYREGYFQDSVCFYYEKTKSENGDTVSFYSYISDEKVPFILSNKKDKKNSLIVNGKVIYYSIEGIIDCIFSKSGKEFIVYIQKNKNLKEFLFFKDSNLVNKEIDSGCKKYFFTDNKLNTLEEKKKKEKKELFLNNKKIMSGYNSIVFYKSTPFIGLNQNLKYNTEAYIKKNYYPEPMQPFYYRKNLYTYIIFLFSKRNKSKFRLGIIQDNDLIDCVDFKLELSENQLEKIKSNQNLSYNDFDDNFRYKKFENDLGIYDTLKKNRLIRILENNKMFSFKQSTIFFYYESVYIFGTSIFFPLEPSYYKDIFFDKFVKIDFRDRNLNTFMNIILYDLDLEFKYAKNRLTNKNEVFVNSWIVNGINPYFKGYTYFKDEKIYIRPEINQKNKSLDVSIMSKKGILGWY